MIRAGLRKNDTGKIKRRNENPNGDDWYLVQLDDGGTALYRRSQLDDAQAMMNAIGAMDTSSETPQQSEVVSEPVAQLITRYERKALEAQKRPHEEPEEDDAQAQKRLREEPEEEEGGLDTSDRDVLDQIMRS